MNREAIVNFVAFVIAICIYILPIVGLVKLIKALINKRKKSKQEKSENNKEEWNADWYLNPETGLWTNRKNEEEISRQQQEGVTYRLKGKDIFRDKQEEQIKHFYHTDTTFTAKQTPQTKTVNTSTSTNNDRSTQNTEPIKENYQTYTPPKTEPADRYVYPNQFQIPGYKAKYLLTQNEWYEHKKLRDYAAQKGLTVCPKVRLLDLVTPYGNGKEYMTRFHKVQAKHVDFVLVDDSMHVKAIVELDDNSHNAKDRQERDEFVDSVLSSVGYTVIHTRSITKDTLRGI